MGKRQFSGLLRVEHGHGMFQNVAVFNTLLFDVFANSLKYKRRPGHYPDSVSWQEARRVVSSGNTLSKIIKAINKMESVVLAREWENYGYKFGFKKYGGGSEDVKSLFELRENFSLLKLGDWEKTPTFPLRKIKPASWQVEWSVPSDPYPSWALSPKGKAWKRASTSTKKVATSWIQFLKVFNKVYSSDFPKKSFIILASDVPWHMLFHKELKPNPEHSMLFVEKVVLPLVKEIDKPDLTKVTERLLKDIKSVK